MRIQSIHRLPSLVVGYRCRSGLSPTHVLDVQLDSRVASLSPPNLVYFQLVCTTPKKESEALALIFSETTSYTYDSAGVLGLRGVCERWCYTCLVSVGF